ncbi:MAG TPA: hypothetical protein VFA87_03345, partial [Rhizomicrobium sp.]|nr:hypothetical protein [Rhizomicrobium sp.]
VKGAVTRIVKDKIGDFDHLARISESGDGLLITLCHISNNLLKASPLNSPLFHARNAWLLSEIPCVLP